MAISITWYIFKMQAFNFFQHHKNALIKNVF